MATGSTLETLIKDLLLSVDSYNPNDVDPTVDETSGNQARRALNQALQKIYSLVKDTTVLQKEASTTIASVADQDYIDISGVSDLDDIVNIFDPDNNRNLERVTFQKYREMYPDPSESTGDPVVYARWGDDRIYLGERPDSSITYTMFYIKKITSNLSATSDTTSIDSKFDYWILAEARVFWQLMEDAADSGRLTAFVLTSKECRDAAMADLNSNFDLSDEFDSHFDDISVKTPRFDSPIGS